MTRVDLHDEAGDFAADKDLAQMLRETTLRPALDRNEEVILDFRGVEVATQSFIHALISDLVRSESLDALDHLVFEHCNDEIRGMVELVVDYSQDDIAVADIP